MSHDRRDDQRQPGQPGQPSEQGADAASNAPAAPQVSAWLRALAEHAEADPAFAAQLLAAVRESGLAGASDAAASSQQRTPAKPAKKAARPRGAARATTPSDATQAPPDPFSVYRAQGEAGLRATLDGLDLATLRAIVRERRLDPARISARWTTRERVISLIVDQVKARANHGHAFERV